MSVEPFHLFRHLEEQAFRFNEQTLNDAERFSLAIAGTLGKRVMYREFIGALRAAGGRARIGQQLRRGRKPK